MSTSDSDQPHPPARAADRLRARKDRVMSLWEARLRREVPAAGKEPHLILIDTLPAIVDELVQALDPHHARRDATEGSTLATEHGGERVRVTHFQIEDLITEYKLLRQVLFEQLEEDGPLSAEERNILNLSVDETMSKACTGFALVQASFRDQLFAMVAHDLRNPLSTALTTARLIQQVPAAPQVPQWADRIVDNIRRVDRMVRDILDAMRVQTGGRLHLDLEACDLVDIVRRTLDDLRLEHGDRLILNASQPVLGYFAPDGLRRAVENLSINAVKYGAPARPITVTVRQEHGRAILSVHNEGGAIPEDKKETLFRAFQRATTPEASDKRGWGLGLAQVRAVAEAHGGSIGVQSTAADGTTFSVDIPLDARPYQNSLMFAAQDPQP